MKISKTTKLNGKLPKFEGFAMGKKDVILAVMLQLNRLISISQTNIPVK